VQETWIGLVAVAAAFLAIFMAFNRPSKRLVARHEMARIEEITAVTPGGIVATVLLIGRNLLKFAMFFGGSKSAIQEAALGTILIAGNVVWCTGMIIGPQADLCSHSASRAATRSAVKPSVAALVARCGQCFIRGRQF
jgi:hypothetical protein